MRIFSGARPTGPLHFGNYAGAIAQWQDLLANTENEGYFCIVDLHALIDTPPPETLKKHIHEAITSYLALGLRNDRFHIFLQSHVPAHSEIAWILSTITGLGALERMTQFKDKAGYAEILRVRDHVVDGLETTVDELDMMRAKGEGAHHRMVRDEFRDMQRRYNDLKQKLDDLQAILSSRDKHTSAALLSYPILMAGDILLYDTDIVPVGEDQIQHIELTRDLAERFNSRYGDTFVVPKAKIQNTGARIMSLQDPERKMSKSLGPAHYLGLFEPEDIVRKKIKSAVTDSEPSISYDPKKRPAVANLLTIMSIVSEQSIDDTVKEFKDTGYGAFKEELAERFLSFFEEARDTKHSLENKEVVDEIQEGAESAAEQADAKMRTIHERLGLS